MSPLNHYIGLFYTDKNFKVGCLQLAYLFSYEICEAATQTGPN